ncbi:MAG: hypothetical protein QXF52_02900 [Thermoproteota archaeon]
MTKELYRPSDLAEALTFLKIENRGSENLRKLHAPTVGGLVDVPISIVAFKGRVSKNFD